MLFLIIDRAAGASASDGKEDGDGLVGYWVAGLVIPYNALIINALWNGLTIGGKNQDAQKGDRGK